MPLTGWEKVARSDPVYRACVAGTTALGGVSGVILGGAAAPATGGLSFALVPEGLALGFAAGLLVCPYLAPAIRRKIGDGDPLGDFEVRAAAEAVGRYAGVVRADEALRLLALSTAVGRRAGGAPACTSAPAAARQILALTGRTA